MSDVYYSVKLFILLAFQSTLFIPLAWQKIFSVKLFIDILFPVNNIIWLDLKSRKRLFHYCQAYTEHIWNREKDYFTIVKHIQNTEFESIIFRSGRQLGRDFFTNSFNILLWLKIPIWPEEEPHSRDSLAFLRWGSLTGIYIFFMFRSPVFLLQFSAASSLHQLFCDIRHALLIQVFFLLRQ
jgi:hypothetical protein